MSQLQQNGFGFAKLFRILIQPFYDKNVVVAVRLSNEPRERKNVVSLNPIYNITDNNLDGLTTAAISHMASNLALFEKTLKNSGMDDGVIAQLVIQYHQAMLQASVHQKYIP